MSETKNLKLFKHEEPLETNNNKFDIDKALNKNWDKVDDYAGEANSKIDLITEIIDLLPKVSNEGESITLENTARAKFTKFRIGGNSSQETRSGYNLLNVPAEYHISSTDINKIVPISLKANTTYTIQAEKIISDNSDAKDCLFRFRYNNADVSNPYARIPISTLKTTYTPPSDIDTVWIYSSTDYNESTISNTTFENLMIYEGTEATEYEPYGAMPSQNYPSEIKNVKDNINIKIADKNNEEQQEILFPLVQGQKLMQGDYLADDGIHHKRKQIVLDGTENWVTLTVQKGDNTSYFYYAKTDMKKASSIICNQFINRAVWSIDVEGIQSITDNLIRLRINTSRASTVSELKAWLAAQKEAGTPVTVEYELVKEEVETYTEEQKEVYEQIKNAISYKGQTNIFSTNEIKPIFEVEALADIGLLLNNMQAQILAGGE